MELDTWPNNTPEPFNAARFPRITAYDNVMAQKRVIDSFGIKKIKLVTGWSMGANQTYHWAALFPDMVQNILPIMMIPVFVDMVTAQQKLLPNS